MINWLSNSTTFFSIEYCSSSFNTLILNEIVNLNLELHIKMVSYIISTCFVLWAFFLDHFSNQENIILYSISVKLENARMIGFIFPIFWLQYRFVPNIRFNWNNLFGQVHYFVVDEIPCHMIITHTHLRMCGTWKMFDCIVHTFKWCAAILFIVM